MLSFLNKALTPRQVLLLELFIMLVFSVLPLLTALPYRVNIFLTWEGAYRMYLGQMPFRDFGMPLGYGFWIIPFVFFKLLGPYLLSLVVAQAFINFISLLTFRGILRAFGLQGMQTLLPILVLCLSFVMVNFWPWYNHTVFVFELIGIWFLVRYLTGYRKLFMLALSAFFIALSFFTKQDAGGLALMLALALIAAHGFLQKEIKPLLFFAGFYAVAMALLIVPLLRYDFGYWFNHGQPPHFSRINLFDFLTAFFEESLWIKFYIGCVIVLALMRFKSWAAVAEDRTFFLFTLFTLGILAQAMIIQVTSFSPVTVNYYFHSFALAFLMASLGHAISLEKRWIALVLILLVFFWRSENYWKYSNRLLGKVLPSVFAPPPPDVVSKHSWSSKADSVKATPVNWRLTRYTSLKRIKLPENTADGVDRLMAMDLVKKENLRVLNMSNLSVLAYELQYPLEHGPQFPLWYHRGVAFFDREKDLLCRNLAAGTYDLILFEDMPDVDNFFPYAVRDCALQSGYVLTDRFLAPTGYTTDSVEVYIKKPVQ